MKKLILFCSCILSVQSIIGQVNVTFNVDMTNEIVNPTGVHIAGNFEDVNYDGISENPSLLNWNPGVYELTDADMDGVYSITLQLVSAVYEFKFINGNDWAQSEDVPPTCQVEVNGNDNRQMMVGTAVMNYEVCFAQCAACGESAVRFRVDMSTQPAVNPVGVHVAGNFQNPFADGDGSGDWDVDASPLQDWNGDNIWEGVYSVGSMTAIEYKFINGDDWANPNENVSGPCGPGNGNRTATIESINTTLPSYCWNLCIECTVGCTNPIACNFNEIAVTDDGSCFYPDPCGDCLGSGIAGCIDPLACNYNSIATCSDNSCAYPGCNNPLACNYDSAAGCDDGSCLYLDVCGVCGGESFAACTNPLACNYNPEANCDDNSCILAGCTDTNACNFNPTAGCDDGSCLFLNTSCSDNNPNTMLDTVAPNCNCVGTPFNYGSIASSAISLCPGAVANAITASAPLNITDYSVQWYYKEGTFTCPSGDTYAGWIAVDGATSISYNPTEFTGTRTFACFMSPSAIYTIPNQWIPGCKVIGYYVFDAQPIIGNPNITPFSTITYAVNPIAGNTFNWTVTNGAIVSGQGTSVIQVLWGQNGPYQVSLSEGNGVCGDISNLLVVNSSCSLSAAITSTNGNAFCPGGTNELIASSNGTNLSYTWYLDGVEISGATEQSFGITSAGNYQVMVNDGLCSAVSQILNISQLPGVQWPEITVMEQNADCASASATITAAGGNATSYVWSSGETTPEITITASGEYVLTVTNDSGCSAELPTIVINFAQSEAVPVCLVTVDSATGHNVIVWEPVTSEVTNAYVVYKETNVADVYEPIGTVPYGSDGIFEDVNSNSAVQASRYKLALIDTCDIESSLSDLHKTIHLTSNLGVGNTVNLIWSHYEGFAFGSYTIYRGTTPDDMALLATIASNLNSYTDLLPLTNGYYMIEVEGVSCDPSRSVQTSKSNIINYEFVGVDEQMASQIKIYPNPATDRLTLQCDGGMRGATYDIYDATGRVVLTGPVTATTVDIDVRLLQAGLYVVRVRQSTLHWVKN